MTALLTRFIAITCIICSPCFAADPIHPEFVAVARPYGSIAMSATYEWKTPPPVFNFGLLHHQVANKCRELNFFTADLLVPPRTKCHNVECTTVVEYYCTY